MSDNGGTTAPQWVVKGFRPWWHRGAAAAAMVLLLSGIGLWWAERWTGALFMLALAGLAATIDSALSK